MFFFKLRLSESVMRAVELHETLSGGRVQGILNDAQATASADAIRDETAAPVTFFVDELQNVCSELTCLAAL